MSAEKEQIMRCDEVQDVLLEYLSRELGSARSEFVGQHLRKCESCQAAARELQATLNVLREASRSGPAIPEHLSRERRARIVRAYIHPILDWIYVHHILVSVIVAVLVIAVAFYAVRRARLLDEEELPDTVTVTIRHGSAATNGSADKAVGPMGVPLPLRDASEPEDVLPKIQD